jgi:nucleotide-binding universal stress UspA family protein
MAVKRPVLLCVDGSEGANHAVETAAQLLGGSVLVVSVWEPVGELSQTNPWGAFISAVGQSAAELDAIAEEIAGETAEKAAELARRSGFVEAEALGARSRGSIWSTLLELADERDARLVVAGARGQSQVRSLLLGSVSHAVVQHARRPVLIVPPPAL